jgi:hypothetical protein
MRIKIVADRVDAAIFDAHIGRTVPAGGRVDDVAVLNEKRRHGGILG